MIVFVAARGALARRGVMYKSARLALEAHRALFRLPEAPVVRDANSWERVVPESRPMVP